MPALCLFGPCFLLELGLAIHTAWGWGFHLSTCPVSKALSSTSAQVLLTPRILFLM